MCSSLRTWQGLATGLCLLKGEEIEAEGERKKEGRKEGGKEGEGRRGGRKSNQETGG